MIRVLVADDNAVIRQGVKSLLEACAPDIVVVAEAGNGREAIALAAEHEPDVVLLDVRMPVMDGIEAAGRLSQSARVLMLTYGEDEALVTGAIRAGASGYLVHGRFDPEQLDAAVREVAEGRSALSPSVTATVMDVLRRDDRPAPESFARPFGLTERENEVMRLVASGATNRDIAERLFISEKTVKNHLSSIFEKLGAARRTEAAARWLGLPKVPGA